MKTKFKDFFSEIVIHLKTADLKSRSSDLAYSILMAAIPLILVFIQVASLFLADPELALYRLTSQFPEGTDDIINAVIDTLASNANEATIGVSLLSVLWLGSNGINSLIISANESFGFEIRQPGIVQRIISAVYTAIFIIVIIFMLLFYVFYDSIHFLIGNVLFIEEVLGDVWDFAGNIIIRILPLVIMVFILISFYKSSTFVSNEQISWREAAVGGVFASISSIIITVVYSWFMSNISSWSLYYGSLATVLALFVWLRMICQVMVAGGEIISAYRAVQGKENMSNRAFQRKR